MRKKTLMGVAAAMGMRIALVPADKQGDNVGRCEISLLAFFVCCMGNKIL